MTGKKESMYAAYYHNINQIARELADAAMAKVGGKNRLTAKIVLMKAAQLMEGEYQTSIEDFTPIPVKPIEVPIPTLAGKRKKERKRAEAAQQPAQPEGEEG